MLPSAGTPCPDNRTLEQLLLGCLTGSEAEQLEAHIAACTRCVAVAQALQPADAVVRALHGADDGPTVPQQELIDAVVPLLKRLRPSDMTETVPPRGGRGVAAASANDTTGSFGPATPVGDALEITSLGDYRVLRQLGAGGMGVVYLAEDPQLRRQVALKVIRPELVARADLRKRFLSEAQAVAAVEHDHIVAIFHVGEHDGVPYLVMPLLRGKTLEERLRETDGPLPIDEFLRIGRQTAEGLAAAHARGLVHRDVKPNNIFLESAGGRVKILDFGLAHLVQEETAGPEGTVTGTPAYMAPEQGRGEPADARCDLFSLGCVLYRMATGRAPFRGDDVVSVLLSVALDQPPLPRTLNPHIAPALDALILQLLAKRGEDRPASAQAVADTLRAIEHQRAEARRPRPRRWPWIGAAVAAVLLAIGLTTWLLHGEAVPPEPGQVTFEHQAADPRLILQRDDEPEQLVDLQVNRIVTLAPGDYAIRSAQEQPGRRLMPDRMLVKPGEAMVVPLALVGEVRKHELHQRAVTAVALSPVPGSLQALSTSLDRSVVSWDAGANGEPRTLGEHHDPIHCLALSGDGQRVATGSGGRAPPRRKADCTICIWDSEGRREPIVLTGHDSWVTSVAFAPDGLQLLAGGADGTLFVWDLKTNTVRHRLAGHDAVHVRGVGFAPDGKQALSCGDDKMILLWDVVKGQLTRRLAEQPEALRAAVFAPDGDHIASAGEDGTVRVWEIKTGTCRVMRGHKEAVHAVAWSRDGRRLLSGGEDGTVRLWDAASGTELATLTGHRARVNGVAFSANGRHALSGSSDRTVRLWELPR
jgi:eukaryotic-like serine/threonine-protein kinase